MPPFAKDTGPAIDYLTEKAEKAMKGLRCCRGDGFASRECPPDCPYADADETDGYCDALMMRDAEDVIGRMKNLIRRE